MPDLIIHFTPTTPEPEFGYYIKYRKQGDTVYSHVSAAGSPMSIPVPEVAVYEGSVIARCSASMSTPVAFTAVVCPEILIAVDITRNAGDSTKADATASATGGIAPYTYLWSTGATTPTVTGLEKNVTYTLTVTDAAGCHNTVDVTPNIAILTGLKMELMYFSVVNGVPSDDLYYPRLNATGHSCNRARFEMFVNNVSQGIANLNNAGPPPANPWNVDDGNIPPGTYFGASAGDRYWSKTLSPEDAEAIADPVDGTLTISAKWTGDGNTIGEIAHADAAWLRITKTSDGSVILSTTLDAFSDYVFDPYA